MNTTKGIATIVIVVLVVGILMGGGAYFLSKSRQKKALEELKTAKALLENDKIDAAVILLKEHVTKYPRMATMPEALFLLGKTLQDHDADLSKSRMVFERILKEYPASPYSIQAQYYKALALLDEKTISDDSVDFFKSLLEKPGNRQNAFVAQCGLALAQLKEGKTQDAKAQMDDLLEKEIPESLRPRIENALGDLNLRLLYSPELSEGDESYTTQKGDYIYTLARKYNITQELLMKCNNISDPKRMGTGQRLKIPKVSFSIVVDKHANTLTLMSNGKFFKKYKVRTGAYENQTPTGEYKIENKKKDPRWVNPRNHKTYGPGDPENELGTRWMSFQSDMLGIHGTIKPETVGYYSSFGCVGMYSEDVETLFDFIPVGTPVKIVGQMNPRIVEQSKMLGFRD